MFNKKNCGKQIKKLRKKKEWTQEELASTVNLACETISGIERGKKGFSIQVLCILCDVLECTPNDILEYHDQNFEQKSLLDELSNLVDKYKN